MAMKIALVQFDCKLGDVDANVAAMVGHIAAAARDGADLVVFPETSDTGYDMPTIRRRAGPADRSAATRASLAAAARAHGVNVIAGLTLAEPDGRICNASAAFARDGTLLGEYRKIHLFGGETNREQDVFEAGDARRVVDLDGARVGMMICYDLRFPELARSLVLDGADVLVIVAAWPMARVDHWRLLSAARALENQCAVVAVNRAGFDGAGGAMGGRSSAFGPSGECLCDCDDASPRTVGCAIDPESIRAARRQFPWLRDRRPEMYRL
jgi:predicted amidohydrolase